MSATTLSEPQNVIGARFALCRAERRAALIPYVTAGYPEPALTGGILEMLAEAGADVIEIGVPFSDPLADGPTIQHSSFEAIRQGTDLGWTLEALARFREACCTPVVLFSYLNPILRYGTERFLSDAVEVGAQGVLLTDLPVGSDRELEARIDGSGLDRIRLVSPTTLPERVERIAGGARGFLYYVSRTGVTGAQTELSGSLAAEVGEVRRRSPVPVAVGFGVSSPEQARAVAGLADGVVVGSALVTRLATEGIEPTARFVGALRAAVEWGDDAGPE